MEGCSERVWCVLIVGREKKKLVVRKLIFDSRYLVVYEFLSMFVPSYSNFLKSRDFGVCMRYLGYV